MSSHRLLCTSLALERRSWLDGVTSSALRCLCLIVGMACTHGSTKSLSLHRTCIGGAAGEGSAEVKLFFQALIRDACITCFLGIMAGSLYTAGLSACVLSCLGVTLSAHSGNPLHG